MKEYLTPDFHTSIFEIEDVMGESGKEIIGGEVVGGEDDPFGNNVDIIDVLG